MSLKEELIELAERLPEDATWEDVLEYGIREQKITSLLTGDELAYAKMEDGDVQTVLNRIHAARSTPQDMLSDEELPKVEPYTTWAIGAGVVSFLPIPILSWILMVVAAGAGIVGTLKGQAKAWVGIALALVSFLWSPLSEPLWKFLEKLAGQ